MEENQLTTLIAKYLAGNCTDEEKKFVEDWYEQFDEFGARFYKGDTDRINESAIQSLQIIRQKIKGQLPETETVVIPLRENNPKWWRMVAAAVLLVLVTGTVLLLLKRPTGQPQSTAEQRYENDVLPGNDKAVLTLTDGRQIILDSNAKGMLSKEGNTTVINLEGQLSYTAANTPLKDVSTGFNTISTPRGGQYKIILPDGSKVWLDAASSLQFPVVFTGGKRNVMLNGEAYFEVAKNPAMPFTVQVNNTQVQVLGTHFNVMAYEDEDVMKTTLLEGSVKVIKGADTGLLLPGQQAQVRHEGQIKIIAHADTDEAIAWKDHSFSFNDADIHSIMRQVSRWYDVQVVYEANIPRTFVATISRDLPVSKILHLLELTEAVHFKIEGKKITVLQ